MAFDASPSWSGFNYQGKIALYHALNLINAKPIHANLSNHSLMLENTEDFEIMIDGAPVSFHQVKAYNSSSYSEYSNALLGITLELFKEPRAIGRVHTWKIINSKPGQQNLIESVRDDLTQTCQQYSNKIPKDGSTTIEKAASVEPRVSKKASIIRSALSGNTPDQIHKILLSISNLQNNSLSRLSAYQYNDGNCFCDLDEVNNKIEAEIGLFFDNRGLDNTEEKRHKTFLYFLGVMDNYIIQRHKSKQKEEKIQISFNEIILSLEADHEDIGREYLSCRFKEKFACLIDEYIEDIEDYIEPEEEQRCNLREARNTLLSLSPHQLWEHYRSFSPHKNLDHSNNVDNALEVDNLGIQYALTKILHKINCERAFHDTSKSRITYRANTPPYEAYLPTTITGLEKTSRIERQIISNPCMSEILFEIDNLIYDGSVTHTFSPASLVHTEAPAAEDGDRRSKRDEILSNITLIPLESAKEALT